MKNRMDILTELLLELNNICKNNSLKYTVTGEMATEIVEQNSFPFQFDYITVAMTMGDIERLIDIVNNDGDNSRQIEYILNNPLARGLQIRYCNSNTTLINVKEIGGHINYGMYIKILPITRVVESKMKNRILKICRKGLRASTKSFASCHWKRLIPVAILKCIVGVLGQERSRRMLYNYNKKLHFIDTWEDIYTCEKIRIGRGRFDGQREWQINQYNINDAELFVTEEVVGRTVEKTPTHATVLMNDIENSEMPFTKVINSDIVKSLSKTQDERNKYLKIVTKANKPAKVMAYNWNIYLMTRDVVAFRDMYTEEVIEEIKALIEKNEQEEYFEIMRPYLSARVKWKRNNIPFLPNEQLEEMIEVAKAQFDEEEKVV